MLVSDTKDTGGLSVVSYNLKWHEAYPDLERLVTAHDPDIICLQECFTRKLQPRIGGLALAGRTTAGQLGLALYCRDSRFAVKNATSHALPVSLYERVRPDIRERLLVAKLYDNVAHTDIYAASFHATHLVASNRVRRQQMRYAFAVLSKLCGGAPAILAGDYNYPLFHRGLGRFIQKNGYHLVKSNAHTFKGYIFNVDFTCNIDFASVTNVSHATATTLPSGLSDHAPVLVKVSI